ncbi:hypothetical protein Calkr_2338 [Caldicellulosiruptor acetigenus I77R1B]|uniref:Uncharacterized protein n=1 Tax=Caldicellulosiruptor acetigenus (strain ATCC 700853 / DSM 12137 / I77R1B) TaxID=632335 RepID=E4S7A4_CALA7|nr:hypothetical protein [Caldicellulosiruptor acetigenus]ADQ41787.1 hypothetical protein Calkr_2338 [Caldicellulosiruptor acetigenus I77R1B]
MRKIFVEVYAHFSKEGEITPISFVWLDGKTYEIDKIIEKRNAASLKAGGQGIRYKILVRSKILYLFCDENRWFVEFIHY